MRSTAQRMTQRERILAVDDDPLNLMVLEELLGEQYRLKTLDGGSRVLETMRAFRPDLVLLDIMMPDANGYEVCRQIRSDPELKRTKVVLVSAKAQVAERLEGYEAGADDYVAKPFVLDEFAAKVRVHLRLKSTEELDDLKSQFLTLLNHETRTPLSGIMAAGELIGSELELPVAQRQELARIVVESARRLHRLLERATLLSQLRAGGTEHDCGPFDCAQLVRSTVESAIAGIQESEVGIRVGGAHAAYVVADPGGVRAAFEAVLDNAIRFSPRGSEVEIEIVAGADTVSVTIADHGPGMEPDLLTRIWDGFHVGDLAHHTHGQGIGLALARGMLTAVGGAIDIASEPNRGTRVAITLPAAQHLSA